MAQARPLFTSIAEDRSGGYYGTAARQRLSRLPMPTPQPAPKQTLASGGPATSESPNRSRVFGPGRSAEFLFAGTNEDDSALPAEETESEETLAATPPATAVIAKEDVDESPDATDETDADDVASSEDNAVLEPGGLTKNAANAVHFDRAQMLLKMGFNDEVRWELYEIEKRIHSKEELKTLVTIYQQSGNFQRSSNLAQLRYGNLKKAPGDAAQQFWQAAYPQAYKADVVSSAHENSIPSEFIWGIMRAESQYKRDAVSPVGAMGLMQIMPGTGRKLASLKQDKEFSPMKLLQSDTAIHYGAYYLKRLSKLFDGSLPLTAAAYNAGPHRVHAWLLTFGSLDMDEFIEHIPFLETREYVRRVVANTLIYSNLYGGGHDDVDLASPVGVKGRAEWSRKEIWE